LLDLEGLGRSPLLLVVLSKPLHGIIQIFAIAEPTIAGAALKLRIAAYHMRMPGGGDIPSNPLDNNEKMIAGALADAERLAGVAA
jgi:hypothetical protein